MTDRTYVRSYTKKVVTLSELVLILKKGGDFIRVSLNSKKLRKDGRMMTIWFSEVISTHRFD